MDNLKITIPGKPEYMTMIRLAITSLATYAGFDVENAEEIKMAVVEACKNISCHGSQGFSDKYEIEVNLEKGSNFEVTVTDACDSHTIEKLEKPCRMCPQEGDIGAIMIHTLMDCVEVGQTEDGHKYINMVKRIADSQAAGKAAGADSGAGKSSGSEADDESEKNQ